MSVNKKKKVGARPQKVNIRKGGTSASCGPAGGCAGRDADARNVTAARPAAPFREGGKACGGIEIKVGYASAAAAGISGDAAASCGLPGGSRALILSDGMGKGIKAAAGSRLVVTRLRRNLKTGMPVAQAIKEVNRYMIEQAESAAARLPADTDFESSQINGQADRSASQCGSQRCCLGEDFATVDLTVIDRQSRRARFYKMGAATSFIMRGGRVRKIKGAALPVGIIPTLRLTHISAVLKEGDLILMASDGITDADREDPEAEWLCEYLSKAVYSTDFDVESSSARHIASEILKQAITRYGLRERDDLTVAVALIVKRNSGTTEATAAEDTQKHKR